MSGDTGLTSGSTSGGGLLFAALQRDYHAQAQSIQGLLEPADFIFTGHPDFFLQIFAAGEVGGGYGQLFKRGHQTVDRYKRQDQGEDQNAGHHRDQGRHQFLLGRINNRQG